MFMAEGASAERINGRVPRGILLAVRAECGVAIVHVGRAGISTPWSPDAKGTRWCGRRHGVGRGLRGAVRSALTGCERYRESWRRDVVENAHGRGGRKVKQKNQRNHASDRPVRTSAARALGSMAALVRSLCSLPPTDITALTCGESVADPTRQSMPTPAVRAGDCV